MYDEEVYYTLSAISAELGQDAATIAETIVSFNVQPIAMVAIVIGGILMEVPVYDFTSVRNALEGGASL